MDEALVRKIMPHDTLVEQAVIGSMLMDNEAIEIATEIVNADDFYETQYKNVFEAITALYNEGKNVDVVTLQDRLKSMQVPEQYSDASFLMEAVDAVPISGGIKEHARIVKEKSILRKLITINDGISKDCYTGKKSIDEILEETEKEVFKLTQYRNVGEMTSIRDIVVSALGNIEKSSKMNGVVTGIPSGFTDLDYMTAGFHNSDLVLIAARPAMGKTSFELNIAEYMCFRKKMKVALFSLEMSKEQLVNRLLSMESGVDSQKIRTGSLDEEDWMRLAESSVVIGESGLIIDDTPSISIGELRSKCRKYKLEGGLDIVMIDYLQLMTAGGKVENRQNEISEISRKLKALAREIDVPVIALSQLSRAVEKRDKNDRRPMLSDLRESGAIEQDADMVMFLYRDDYYNKDSEKKGISEVIIAKQRNGPIGTVELAWLPERTKFRNLPKKGFGDNQ
ncbi:replicative DNA helicase [Lachnospiraceae bacterium RM5]|nr:replicative DNA helicase [Lachnospiraceae bacterium RM5]